MSNLDQFDPLSAATLSRPYAYWAALRREAPVRRIHFPNNERPTYVVSRRADVLAVARDPATYSSMAPSEIWRWGDLGPTLQPILTAEGWPIVHTIASADPPIHAEYRKLVTPMFSRGQVRRLSEKIETSINELLRDLPVGKSFDFMKQYAIPLPIMMIADMLGLTPEDRERVYHFTDVFVRMVDPTSSGANAAKAVREFAAGQRLLAAYIERYESHPDDSLFSTVANARHANGECYSMEERLSLCYLLMAAGNETTRNGLSLCAYYLARYPELWRTLQADRGKIANYVEEALRVGTPATLNPRLVTRDTVLCGEAIKCGSVVFMLWGSANRDESTYPDADQIRLDRPSPQNHAAFGHGIHSCVGAPLAREELNLSVQAWLERYHTWSFAVPEEQIVHEPLFGFRSFPTLPIIAT